MSSERTSLLFLGRFSVTRLVNVSRQLQLFDRGEPTSSGSRRWLVAPVAPVPGGAASDCPSAPAALNPASQEHLAAQQMPHVPEPFMTTRGLGGAISQAWGPAIREQSGVATWGGDPGRTHCLFLKPGDGLGQITPLGERAEGGSSHLDHRPSPLQLPL